MCGDGLQRTHPENEKNSLDILKRGSLLKEDLNRRKLTIDKVFFAMPLNENQLDSGIWNKDMELKEALKRINQSLLLP